MRNSLDTDAAVQRFDRDSIAPDVDERTRQQLYNYKGIVLHSKKDYDGAIASYDKALELDPEFAEAHCNKGSALDDKGDTDAAISCFKRALELEDRTETHYNIGLAYYNKTESQQPKERNYDFGIVHLEQAVAMHPNFKEALTALGNALYHKGMQPGRGKAEKEELCEKAVEKYKKSLELDRHQKATHVALGNVYRLAFFDYDRAIIHFDEAIQIDAKYTAAWACRGNCYYQRSQSSKANAGDVDQAVESFDRALELDPRNDQFKQNREVAKGSSGCGCSTCAVM